MTASPDTIFALSSGNPPAAIAVMRVSGPCAATAVQTLAGALPAPRRASHRRLTNPVDGAVLDHALVLWFPGPKTATGEDLAEFHLHGGRAVVAEVAEALATIDGLRPAEAGEFTRRAFLNGRIDLAEAEGLADLLAAETRSQRVAALRLAGGGLSREVEGWQRRVLHIAADVEAALDFSDEGDVPDAETKGIGSRIEELAGEMAALLSRPSADRLKDGVTVALAGPVNAGKSSLINALAEREVAIASPIPGTTRDLIEAPLSFHGIPFRLIDMAGLRESSDEVEAIGVERARNVLRTADIVLWLGEPEQGTEAERTIVVRSKSDLGLGESDNADVSVSSITGEGLESLIDMLVSRASSLLPVEGEIAINARHRRHIGECQVQLAAASHMDDLLIAAENLRRARAELDAVTGRAGVENMLDTLFGSFCIGK